MGWQYGYSTMMYLLPDGSSTSIGGIGNEPNIFINNTTDAIQQGNDLVIDRALLYLWEIYGIE